MSNNEIFYVLDENENVVAVLSNTLPNACPYYEDKHTERLEHGYLTLEFKVPMNHPTSTLLVSEGFIIYPYDDGEYQLFKIKETDENATKEAQEKYVYCENAAVPDLLGIIIRPATLNSYTLEQVFSYILSGSEWQLGEVDYAGVQDFKFDDYMTALAAIHEVMDKFGAEIKFRVEFDGTKIKGKYIDVLNRRGEDTGKIFTYGIDLAEVERTVDTKNLVTALIGIGKADANGVRMTFADYTPPYDPRYEKQDDWVGSVEAKDRWGKGKHIFGIYKDEDATNKVELYNNTVKQLDIYSKPIVNYKLTVNLLEQLTGYEAHRVRLGDTIGANDTSFKPELYVNARIIEKVTVKSEPEKTTVTLGEYVPFIYNPIKTIQKLQSKIQLYEEKWNIISQWQDSNDPTKIDGSKVYQGTISSTQIADRTITANNIATGAITSSEIATRTISTNNIATGAVTSNEIAPRTITANNIVQDTITANEIAPRTITANEIAVGTITANEIAAGAITADKIASGSITSNHISTSGIVADSIKGGTLTLGGVNNIKGRLEVQSDDQTPIHFIDSQQASFANAYVGYFKSPTAAFKNSANYTIYIDPVNGSDSNDGLTSSTQLKSLNEAFNRLPDYNDGNITILISSTAGTWSEGNQIILSGIAGAGSITIDFQTRNNVLQTRLKILQCQNTINIQNGTIKNNEVFASNQWYGCLHVEGCTKVNVTNMYFDARQNSKLQYCISVFSSFAKISNCEAYNGANAQVVAAYGGFIDLQGCIGSGGNYGIYIVSSSIIGGAGNIPTGTQSNIQTAQGGVCNVPVGTGGFVLNSGTPPTAPPTSTTTTTFNAIRTASWRNAYGGWRSDNDFLYQGEYQGFGNHRGFIFFDDSAIRAALSGKTVKSARLFLSRRRGGDNGPQSINLYTHNYTTSVIGTSGTPTISLVANNVGSYAVNDKKWISIPISAVTAIQNGTAKGLAFYTSSGSPYCIFDGYNEGSDLMPKLEITYEG